MKKPLLILLILLTVQVLKAQDLCFKAYDAITKQELSTICVGQKVKFVDCTNSAFDPEKEYFTFDQAAINNVVGPGAGDTINSFTYSQPGAFKVRQIRPPLTPGGTTTLIKTFTIIDTPPPVFTTVACGLNQIKVTITDTNYELFDVVFETGVSKNLTKGQSFTYQYATSGAKNITVTAKFIQGTCSSSRSVQFSTLPTLVMPILENVKLESVSAAGNITLALANLQKEYSYIIERQSGSSYVLVDTLKNPASPTQIYAVKNINTQNTVCFRIRPTDKCSSNFGTSNSVCSFPLSSSAANKAITLTWPVYPESGLVRYEIYRNNELYKNVQASPYTDININCGNKYQYQVVAVLNKLTSMQENVKSFSNLSLQTGISNQAPTAGNLISTFNINNTVTLTFKAPTNETFKEITFLKSEGSATFATLGTSNKLTFQDSPNLNSLASCYQATFQDSCGQVSPISNSTCPTLLQVNKKGNQVDLLWSAFLGFASGVKQYEVQKLDATLAIIKVIPVNGLTYSDIISEANEQQLIYRVRVMGNSTGEESFSNIIYINQESDVFVPTAFTPNNDNLNDRFEAKGRFINTFRMQIYNRWGQVIYETKEMQNGWDGRINGKEAPVGTYSYNIVAEDINGKQIIKTGTATLLR